jgi:hypothetical protein
MARWSCRSIAPLRRQRRAEHRSQVPSSSTAARKTSSFSTASHEARGSAPCQVMSEATRPAGADPWQDRPARPTAPGVVGRTEAPSAASPRWPRASGSCCLPRHAPPSFSPRCLHSHVAVRSGAAALAQTGTGHCPVDGNSPAADVGAPTTSHEQRAAQTRTSIANANDPRERATSPCPKQATSSPFPTSRPPASTPCWTSRIA